MFQCSDVLDGDMHLQQIDHSRDVVPRGCDVVGWWGGMWHVGGEMDVAVSVWCRT